MLKIMYLNIFVQYIQIDEPLIPTTPYIRTSDRTEQFCILNELIGTFLQILKPVVAALPSDLNLVIHLCRGNGSCRLKLPYGYHEFLPVFAELKPQPNYLLLEWDDERSQSVEVLFHHLFY
jgi:methionine synthase II (cobalamin-independent)